MKKMIKICILLIAIAMLLQNIISIATIIDIGETSKIERGDLGFYTIQYWSTYREKWMYITYSRTFYTDKEGNKRIAYCVNPDLDGVGWNPGEVSEYTATIENKISDERLWRVYKNGYPYASPEDLDVETEDDAYLATKQAAYFIIQGKKLEEVYSYFRAGETELNEQQLSDIQRRGVKVVNAIYKLVDIGYNGSETMLLKYMEKNGDFEEDKDNPDYYSQIYNTKGKENSATYEIKEIIGAPEGSYISAIDGGEQNVFKGGENFKVMIPKEKIKENYNIQILYKVNANTYPVYYARSNMEQMQNYVVIAEKNEDITSNESLEINPYTSSLKIKKVDTETKEPLEGVKFNISYEDGEVLGEYETDENGNINLNNIRPGVLLVKEVSAKEGYVLNAEINEIDIEYNKSYTLEIENSKIKGKIKIVKTSEDNNNIIHSTAGSAIQSVKFNIYDEKDNFVEQIETNEEGIAISKELEQGKYIIKEVEAGKWYLLNQNVYEVEIKNNNDLIELDITNRSAAPKVDIDKKGPEIATEGKEIKYDFNIKNTGNVELKDFTWYEYLPYEYSKITKLSTGTYNQEVNYNIYYKTNKKSEYMVLEKDLNSKINNYIDITEIYLEEGERITEIKTVFGDVNIGFASEEQPYIYVKIDNNLDENIILLNETILEGKYQEYKVCEEDQVETTIENKIITTKKLPRTGY